MAAGISAGTSSTSAPGNQVVNWGESTFIQGGINAAINHFDVSALRVPGSELREAYLPQEMLKVSFGLTDNLTAEAIGALRLGSDATGAGRHVFLEQRLRAARRQAGVPGFGAFSDQGTDFTPLGGPFIENFQAVPRGPRLTAVGLAASMALSLRWFLPDFGQGTELGFFFVNYHSKLPVISGRTGTQAGIGNSLGTLTAVIATAQGLASGLPFDSAVAIAANAGVQARAAANGGDLSLATATRLRDHRGQHRARRAATSPRRRRRSRRTSTRRQRSYFTEYPEDIQLFGVSFNTQLGDDRHRAAGRGVLTARTCRCSSTTSNCCSRR